MHPQFHTSHILEIHLTGIVDETSPALAHQEPTASCTGHKSSYSSLFESRGCFSHSGDESDAFHSQHSHIGPLAEWKLTQTTHFGKISEQAI